MPAFFRGIIVATEQTANVMERVQCLAPVRFATHCLRGQPVVAGAGEAGWEFGGNSSLSPLPKWRNWQTR